MKKTLQQQLDELEAAAQQATQERDLAVAEVKHLRSQLGAARATEWRVRVNTAEIRQETERDAKWWKVKQGSMLDVWRNRIHLLCTAHEEVCATLAKKIRAFESAGDDLIARLNDLVNAVAEIADMQCLAPDVETHCLCATCRARAALIPFR